MTAPGTLILLVDMFIMLRFLGNPWMWSMPTQKFRERFKEVNDVFAHAAVQSSSEIPSTGQQRVQSRANAQLRPDTLLLDAPPSGARTTAATLPHLAAPGLCPVVEQGS